MDQNFIKLVRAVSALACSTDGRQTVVDGWPQGNNSTCPQLFPKRQFVIESPDAWRIFTIIIIIGRAEPHPYPHFRSSCSAPAGEAHPWGVLFDVISYDQGGATQEMAHV